MLLRLLRVLVFSCVALLPLNALAFGFGGTDRLWTELPDSNRAMKAQTLPDFVALAERLSPAVVNISTEESEAASGSGSEREAPKKHSPGDLFEEYSPPSRSLGSGFIISRDGYILTNEHVVSDPGRIMVSTKDGSQYVAKLVGRDEKTDVALIKIDAKRDLPVAPLGNSDRVRVGEWVIAIGNPFGFDHSVTAGIVSAKGRFIPGNYDEFIQTDASINPGNSGGPLIDLRGEVVGVNSAIYTRTGSSMGIGFAIPINIVKGEIAQLKTSGKVLRGWLGVYIQKVTPDIAQSLSLPTAKGALVAQVLKDGPARSAGIERGDVIVEFNGQAISDSRELPLLVGRTPIGSAATVKLLRHGKTEEVKVTITPSHEEEVALASTSAEHGRPAGAPLGLSVKDLDSGLAKQLGLGDQSGVVISSVEPGSRAEQAGLVPRDIILEVNHETIKDVNSYRHAIEASIKTKMILLLIKRGRSSVYVALKPQA